MNLYIGKKARMGGIWYNCPPVSANNKREASEQLLQLRGGLWGGGTIDALRGKWEKVGGQP